jgi:metal-responsive CopG/Arc/MetJ family transcriptional regulator
MKENPMGRPSLNVKRTSLNLPVGMAERIDALVGPQKRSDFVREALEGALKVAETVVDAQARKR